jgi:hypothetical protein
MDMEKTLYNVKFRDYNGKWYYLDTLDPGKIGPWLAEMYGEFPFNPSSQTQVEIEASPWRKFR